MKCNTPNCDFCKSWKKRVKNKNWKHLGSNNENCKIISRGKRRSILFIMPKMLHLHFFYFFARERSVCDYSRDLLMLRHKFIRIYIYFQYVKQFFSLFLSLSHLLPFVRHFHFTFIMTLKLLSFSVLKKKTWLSKNQLLISFYDIAWFMQFIFARFRLK